MINFIKNLEPRHVATALMFAICTIVVYYVAKGEANKLRTFKEATK